MRDVLWQIWLNCGYFLTVAASGFFLYKLCAPFVRPRNGRFWRVLLFLTLAGSTGMVIWIGDPNLLYTLPAFFALFLLSTRGDRIGRVAVCIILFCLEMSVCALLDTYVERINRNALYDVLELDDLHDLTIHLKGHAVAEITGGNHCHRNHPPLFLMN